MVEIRKLKKMSVYINVLHSIWHLMGAWGICVIIQHLTDYEELSYLPHLYSWHAIFTQHYLYILSGWNEFQQPKQK